MSATQTPWHRARESHLERQLNENDSANLLHGTKIHLEAIEDAACMEQCIHIAFCKYIYHSSC